MEPFLYDLKKILGRPLPGEQAHALLSPPHRISLNQALEKGFTPKESAVLILLYPKFETGIKKWNIVLIKRPDYKGVHSAQVGFPGGRKEASDPDLLTTAIRETHEEVGILIPKYQVLGSLSQLYIPPSNYLVKPYLAFHTEQPLFNPDPREVSYIIEFPVHLLLNDSLINTTSIRISTGLEIEVPYFDICGETVWGATAMLLSELKEILRRNKKS